MKVLIIQTGTISEVIFTSLLLRCLRRRHKGIHLTVLTSSEGFKVLEADDSVNEKFIYGSMIESYSRLSGKKFDYIIDLDSSPRSVWISFLIKGKALRRRIRFSSLGNQGLKNLHQADQYLEIAKPLGVTNDDEGLEYFIPYKDEVPMDWLPHPYNTGYVVFCISASHSTRRLPVSRMIEMCDRINRPVILLGDVGDVDDGIVIEQFFRKAEASVELEEGLLKLNKKTVVYNGCGKFNFHQQASLVRQARCVLTFDNEFIAVASAFQKEVFSIWGNTVLDFGTYPYNTKFTVLENNRVDCRPCSRDGFAKCPLGHFKCMNEIIFDFYIP